MPKRRYKLYRGPWWTRDRVIEGLRRFYRDFGFAPTATAEYQNHQQFTGKGNTGVGLVHVVYWSEYGKLSDKRRADGGAGWVARVEFKGSKTAPRRNCILPLEKLRRVSR